MGCLYRSGSKTVCAPGLLGAGAAAGGGGAGGEAGADRTPGDVGVCPRGFGRREPLGRLCQTPRCSGRASQACPCSQMAVQMLCSVDRRCCQRDCMREQMSQMPRMKSTRQGCLVLLFPGLSTTLCADGSRCAMFLITLPRTVTAGLLSPAAGIPVIRASRTAWNAVIATAFTARGNAVYSVSPGFIRGKPPSLLPPSSGDLEEEGEERGEGYGRLLRVVCLFRYF
jgi:hypothetical protein